MSLFLGRAGEVHADWLAAVCVCVLLRHLLRQHELSISCSAATSLANEVDGNPQHMNDCQTFALSAVVYLQLCSRRGRIQVVAKHSTLAYSKS